MTRLQQQLFDFARLHDWGYDATPTADGGLYVGADCVDRAGNCTREHTTVYNMRALRDWAGY